MGTLIGTWGHLDTHGDAYGDIQRLMGTLGHLWGHGDTYGDMGTLMGTAKGVPWGHGDA